MSQELESLKLQLLKKTEIIDSQRVKLKRYEFSVQEAIIFLGKPVLAYTDWLNGIERNKSPQSLADKQLQLVNAVHTINTLKTDTYSKNLEIKALECIKIALNYLVNARNSIPTPVDINSSLSVETREEILEGVEQLKKSRALSQTLDSGTRHAQNPLDTLNTLNTDKSDRNPLNTDKNDKIYRQETLIKDEDIDGDISNSKRQEKIPEKKTCQDCTQRMLQIDRLNEVIKENQGMIQDFQRQLDQEKEGKERIILSKEILEQELEDLTEQLFEQANNMVIEEAKSKLELETQNISLAAELTGAMKRAQGREDEIQDLKKIISALKTAKIKSSKSNLSLSMIPQMDTEFPKGIFSFEKLPLTTITNNLFIDAILYSEVQDHLSCSDMNSNTQFMKRVLSEDIEPSLFYCYAFSGSLKSIGAGGVGSSFKKRFLDSIIKCLCEVVQEKEFASEDGAEKVKCGLCTVVRCVPFSFRFGQKAEELQVCRFCRDRILACMDFFSYNSFLRINKPSFSILNIFRCFMWLRKRYIYQLMVG